MERRASPPVHPRVEQVPLDKAQVLLKNLPVILSAAGSRAKRMTRRSRRTPTRSTAQPLPQGILLTSGFPSLARVSSCGLVWRGPPLAREMQAANQSQAPKSGGFVYGATGVPARPPESRAGAPRQSAG